jgi:hypothetical protein
LEELDTYLTPTQQAGNDPYWYWINPKKDHLQFYTSSMALYTKLYPTIT